MSSSYHPAQQLRHVIISASVYHACFAHALTTEREEVMGLLMGQTTVDGDAHVWHSDIIPRLDKRPDRVEISAESLVAAPEYATRVGERTGLHTRVLGWYHSHPHITPYPSHVDLRTQATYQMMDPAWVGLIFSVFDASSTRAGHHTGRVALHCFQSTVLSGGADVRHRRVPVAVVPDDFFLDPGRHPEPFARALVSPAQTILAEAHEMRDRAMADELVAIGGDARGTGERSADAAPAGDANAGCAATCGFDHALFEEACRCMIDAQALTASHKLLRPLVSAAAMDGARDAQTAELQRNEELLADLRAEVRQLEEAAVLRVLQRG